MALPRRTFLQASAAAEDLSAIGKTPHTNFAVNVEMWYRKTSSRPPAPWRQPTFCSDVRWCELP
jgi:hypothetical protein